MSLKDKSQPVVDLINELNSSETKIWVDRGTLFIRARISDSNSKELIMQKVQQVNVEKGHDIDIKLFISENWSFLSHGPIYKHLKRIPHSICQFCFTIFLYRYLKNNSLCIFFAII
jgi:hypothetical protein